MVPLLLFLAFGACARPMGDVPKDYIFLQRPEKDRQTWQQIRIDYVEGTNFWQIDESLLDSFKSVLRFFEQSLAVHRYSGSLSSPNTRCGSRSIVMPSNLDLIFVLSPTANTTDFGTVRVCAFDAMDKNPVLVSIDFNLTQANQYRKYSFQLLANLVAKGLGFSAEVYQFARKLDGTLYNDTEIVYSDYDEFGGLIRRLRSPLVLAAATRIFLSDYQTGIPLTDDLSSIEFSSRAMFGDIMSNSPPQFKYQFSTISLSFFQDLGWYLVDLTRASTVLFGAGKDQFLEESCLSGAFPEFCNATTAVRACDAYHLSKATCQSANFTNGCPIYADFSQTGSCQDPSTVDIDTSNEEEVCAECRCFNRTLSTSRPMCHRVSCAESTAKVTIGSKSVDCPSVGGVVSIGGGWLECPPYEVLCGGFSCPDFCRGQGKCVGGKCVCDAQRFGPTCAWNCPALCKYCDGIYCSVCSEHASLDSYSSKCNCRSGYYHNEKTNTCDLCSPSCQTCEKRPGNCLTCVATFVLSADSKCVCTEDSYLSAAGQCVTCDKTCKGCVLSPGNCISCRSGFRLTETNKCVCTQGFYFEASQAACLPCNSRCTTCISSAMCTSCMPSLVLSNGVCDCSIGQSMDSTGTCMPCYDTCATCSTKPSDCVTCISPLYIVHPKYKVCTLGYMSDTIDGLSPTKADFLTVDSKYPMQCMGETYGCLPIVRRGYFFTGGTHIRLGPNKRTGNIYLNPEFQFAAFIRLDSWANDTVILSKVTNKGTPFIVFGISEDRSIFLNLTLRSYGERNFSEYGTVTMKSSIAVQADAWISPRFKLEAYSMTATNPSGTQVTLYLGDSAVQQFIFPEYLYEDIPEELGHNFILGGLWTSAGVEKGFMGYIGEIALRAGYYGGSQWCDCPVCTPSGVCLSNCNFDEEEVGRASCESF